jgi:hypothetical protein
MPRRVKVTPRQAKKLEEMLGSQEARTDVPLSQQLAQQHEAQKKPAAQDYPDAATMHLAQPVAARGCGHLTRCIVIPCKPLNVGEPICEECYLKSLPPNRRGRTNRERNRG